MDNVFPHVTLPLNTNHETYVVFKIATNDVLGIIPTMYIDFKDATQHQTFTITCSKKLLKCIYVTLQFWPWNPLIYEFSLTERCGNFASTLCQYVLVLWKSNKVESYGESINTTKKCILHLLWSGPAVNCVWGRCFYFSVLSHLPSHPFRLWHKMTIKWHKHIK